MCGVRRFRSAYLQTYFQMMLIDDIGKAVSANRTVPVKSLPVHIPKLQPTYPGIFDTNRLDELQDERFLGRLSHHSRLIVLVICLLRYTKQLAKKPNPVSDGILCVQVLYCLAPAFFLIEILNLDSATLINSS